MSAEPSRPTMHDVARVAGVSHATVSRVLNGHTNVAPTTARAVADAIITTGYVPNRAARSLRVQSTDTVVLVARWSVKISRYRRAIVGPGHPATSRRVLPRCKKYRLRAQHSR